MYWHSSSEHVIDGLELHMLHQSQTDKSIAGHPAALPDQTLASSRQDRTQGSSLRLPTDASNN
jgi:hypothetical protein